MKKYISTLLCITLITLSTNAQKKGWSFNAAINPGFGTLDTQLRHSDDEVHDIDYKQSFGVSAGFEHQGRLVTHLTEFRYVQYKFDEYQLKEGNPVYPLPTTFDDIKSYSLMQYTGLNAMSHEKLQIPIYLGLGLEYLEGEPYHNITAMAGLKIRAKFYLTNRLAIYGGIGYIAGIGGSERGVDHGDDSVYLILTHRINYDLGISVKL